MRIVPIKRAVVQGTRQALLVPHQLNRETFRLQEELCLGGDRVRWFRLREQKSSGDSGSSVSHGERVGVLICLH